MAKKIFLFVLIVVLLSNATVNADAARRRVRPQPGAISTGVSSAIRFLDDRRAIIINLTGLNLANSITYTLTYTANDVPQGAQGTITPALGENSTIREVLFGTCSKNVCTYHQNITNARLEIVSKLKTGRIIVKPYLLKA